MLCFSSSRWPLVVSRGTAGALPGPLWLWLSSGTGVMVLLWGFVMRRLRTYRRENAERGGVVPEEPTIVIASQRAGATRRPMTAKQSSSEQELDCFVASAPRNDAELQFLSRRRRAL